MNHHFKMHNKGKFLMLESPEKDKRYEFYAQPIQRSNVDSTIVYYEPCITYCRKLTLGSTESTRMCSIEEGNELYKKLIAKGWNKVTRLTQSFC